MAQPPRRFGDSDNSGGLVAKGRAGDNAEPLSVSQISGALKRAVEDQFGFVRVRGELSGVKRAASGHFYCSLKDEKAVIDGVMWRGNVSRLAFQPEDGLEIVASGKLTTYPGRSKYQIVMEQMELAGEGALLALLEKTRARLEAEGLFATERKRDLPYLPKTIGVVTSPTGSVIRDILHRLADRFPSHVLVWPVLVQGNGAAEQVARAVRGFSDMPESGDTPRPDVVIVARGGGSIEDLWAFNEEVAVRAVAECTIPVISAVGHETDTTLIDFAADRRAPTPTAAAEMAVPVRAELSALLLDLAARQRRSVMQPVKLGRERLDARVKRLPTPANLLQQKGQRLDEAAEGQRRGLKDRAAQAREKLSGLRLSPLALRTRWRDAARDLSALRFNAGLAQRLIDERTEKLAALTRVMRSLDPSTVLERGYARIESADGRTLTSREIAAKEALLRVHFSDGSLDAVPRGKGDTKEPKGTTRSPKPAKRPAKGIEKRQDDLFG